MPRVKIKLLEERCKGCGLCIEFCPRKVLSFSKERNLQGYRVVAFNDFERCNACGICFLMCPEVVFVSEEE